MVRWSRRWAAGEQAKDQLKAILLPDFQRAFACAAGAPMVRPAEKRCEVW